MNAEPPNPHGPKRGGEVPALPRRQVSTDVSSRGVGELREALGRVERQLARTMRTLDTFIQQLDPDTPSDGGVPPGKGAPGDLPAIPAPLADHVRGRQNE